MTLRILMTTSPWLLLLACICAPCFSQGTLVIAHRGASGHLPEHSLAAFALAHGLGADYLEPDVVMTRDRVPIVLHDIHLERVTDVEERYPKRKRADGRFYAIDFDLAEVRTLRLLGSGREPWSGFGIATLEEMLDMTRRLNGSRGTRVGVIPEPKAPAFHLTEGQDVARATWQMLVRKGYSKPQDQAIIQCFEIEALERLHAEGCRLRLVWLTGKMPSPKALDRAARICVGLGPNAKLLAKGRESPLFIQAADRKLALFPYTFRRDRERLNKFLLELRVAGIFTNDPGLARSILDEAAQKSK